MWADCLWDVFSRPLRIRIAVIVDGAGTVAAPKAEDVKQFFDRPRWGGPHAPTEQPVQWLWNSATACGEGRENDLASLFRLLHDIFPKFDSQCSR
jgi:hypothetical protein